MSWRTIGAWNERQARESLSSTPDERKAEEARAWAALQGRHAAALAEVARQEQRVREERAAGLHLALADELAGVETRSGWMLTFDRIQDAQQAGALPARQAQDLRERAIRIALHKGWASPHSEDVRHFLPDGR
jgi:hypothetical protein